jgi:hypothetical protein
VNKSIDVLGISESAFERIVERFLAVPARCFLRMKRSVSLLVTDPSGTGSGSIVHGTYQSPILVQWQKGAADTRVLEIDVVAFE